MGGVDLSLKHSYTPLTFRAMHPFGGLFACNRLLAHASHALEAETLSRHIHPANISTLSRLIQNTSLYMKTRKRCSL